MFASFSLNWRDGPLARSAARLLGAVLGTEAKMANIRRAVLITLAERYTNLIVNFVLIAAISRLLTSHDIGVSAIGLTFIAFAESLRDLPSPYLIQQKDLTREDVWTAFTIMLLVTLAIVVTLWLGSHWIAELYGDAKLGDYLTVLALGLLLGPFERPIMALMRRDMNFVGYASVTIGGVFINAVATIALAWFGFGYMSFAWGMLISNIAVVLLALRARPDLSIFRLHLGNWRRASMFSFYTSASDVLGTASALLPNLALGFFHSAATVGIYNRAVMVSQLPDKIVLNGLKPVVLPAVAELNRNGQCPAYTFLTALSYLTLLQWPILVLIFFAAHAVVDVLLGSHWAATVSIVQVMVIALMANIPPILTYSTLVSVGAVSDYLVFSIWARCTAAIIIVFAAYFGVYWLAVSLFISTPIQSLFAIRAIQKRLPITWREIGQTLKASAVATAFSAIGPLLVLAHAGWNFDLALIDIFIGGLSWTLGLAAGVYVSGHPLAAELERARRALMQSAVGQRFANNLARIAFRRG